jgi:hypothetical protein
MTSTAIVAASGVVLSLALAGPVVLAGTEGQDTGASTGSDLLRFDALDTNRDGVLSRQEAQRSDDLADAWSRVDSNGDGRIDRFEFTAFEGRVSSVYGISGTGNAQDAGQGPLD